MANVNVVTVTPSDTVPLANPCAVIYVGVTGDIAVKLGQDTDVVVFTAVPAGYFQMPCGVSFIMATDTTATDLLAVPRSGYLAPTFRGN